MPTKWEYKLIHRARGWDKDETVKKAPWFKSTVWNRDMEEELVALGEEGWELVAISTRSDYLGGKTYDGLVANYAGFTSSEVWVFKRPKE